MKLYYRVLHRTKIPKHWKLAKNICTKCQHVYEMYYFHFKNLSWLLGCFYFSSLLLTSKCSTLLFLYSKWSTIRSCCPHSASKRFLYQDQLIQNNFFGSSSIWTHDRTKIDWWMESSDVSTELVNPRSSCHSKVPNVLLDEISRWRNVRHKCIIIVVVVNICCWRSQ